jgi:hypothetical protein
MYIFLNVHNTNPNINIHIGTVLYVVMNDESDCRGTRLHTGQPMMTEKKERAQLNYQYHGIDL